MDILSHHSWNVGYKHAIEIQQSLSKKIILRDDFCDINKVAGVDTSSQKNDNFISSAVVLFSFPKMEIIDIKYSSTKTYFPYIPGFLAFREGPSIEKCFKKLKIMPDIIFFDGHGYCHPRRLGLASHMGIILDIPSIGCAKSNLYGNYNLPILEKGNFSYVKQENEIIGAALVTRDKVKPIIVSVGHRVSLNTAITLTLKVSKFRIPEPIRIAHNILKTMN